MNEALVAGAIGVAARFESELLKLRADVLSRDAFEHSATAAALHRVAREKAEFRADVPFTD